MAEKKLEYDALEALLMSDSTPKTTAPPAPLVQPQTATNPATTPAKATPVFHTPNTATKQVAASPVLGKTTLVASPAKTTQTPLGATKLVATPIQQQTRTIQPVIPGKNAVLVPSPLTQIIKQVAVPNPSPTPNPISQPKSEPVAQDSIKDYSDVTRLADINLKKEAELALPDDSGSTSSSLTDEPHFVNMARLKKKMSDYAERRKLRVPDGSVKFLAFALQEYISSLCEQLGKAAKMKVTKPSLPCTVSIDPKKVYAQLRQGIPDSPSSSLTPTVGTPTPTTPISTEEEERKRKNNEELSNQAKREKIDPQASLLGARPGVPPPSKITGVGKEELAKLKELHLRAKTDPVARQELENIKAKISRSLNPEKKLTMRDINLMESQFSAGILLRAEWKKALKEKRKKQIAAQIQQQFTQPTAFLGQSTATTTTVVNTTTAAPTLIQVPTPSTTLQPTAK